MMIFKAFGLVFLVYAIWASVTGVVWAKGGTRSRRIVREESPVYFWVIIVIYAGMSAALMTVF